MKIFIKYFRKGWQRSLTNHSSMLRAFILQIDNISKSINFKVKLGVSIIIFSLLGSTILYATESNSINHNLISSFQSKPLNASKTAPISNSSSKPSQTNEPNISANKTVSSSNNTNSSSSSSVIVNGQNINVPDNGSTQQTINSSNGKVNVSVSSTNSSSESSDGTNIQKSTSLNVSTTSDTSDNSSNSLP